MDLSSYYKCSLFFKEISNLDNFSFFQNELLLKDEKNLNTFEKKEIEYKCKFIQKNTLGKKPVGIICVKDNIKLLLFTLNNLKNNKVFDYLDFIVVDDRSTENIKELCDKFSVNYLRVDNEKGFNFSMLNNIAAKICYDKGCKTIVLWNSDLWVEAVDTIPTLLSLHQEKKCTISGTKLLYPYKSWDGSEETPENIKQNFSSKSSNYRGTVQFGGSLFIFTPQNKIYSPLHNKRFFDKNNIYVNCNKPDLFVTGAFQIIDLQWYINCGGMNPSLSKNFQDVDLCLRAVEEGNLVYYFGENINLLHDESLTISKEKFDKQFLSDNVLYGKLWNVQRFIEKIYNL